MLIHACIHTLLHYYTLHWYMQTYVYVHTITLHYRTRQDKKIRHNTIQYIDFRHNIQYIQCIHYIHAYIHCTALHCIALHFFTLITLHFITIQYNTPYTHAWIHAYIHTSYIHTYKPHPKVGGGCLNVSYVFVSLG